MSDEKFRVEKDVLGEMKVPANVYWGVNTQRAIENFKISGKRIPPLFILALAQLKKACLLANLELGLIEKDLGNALLQAADEIVKEGKYLDQFPIDVFQTGSGTQTNMNMNEVLANRANQILGKPMGKKQPVHPNDHVNKGQSSNDVIPSAMHITAIQLLKANLIPTIKQLIKVLDDKIKEFDGVVKVGRTHLQDAVPIPLSTEFKVYKKQIDQNQQRLLNSCNELKYLPIGGTALGTGIGSSNKFPDLVCIFLSQISGNNFSPNPILAEGIASHNTIVNTSATLRSLALSLLKLANDIRLMGSGPRAGLGELILPANEPGSSIMPGKVNPTQSEALIQVCLQVIGNDAAIASGEAFGSMLDLNVCKPLMIVNLVESINILEGGITSFIEHCLKGLEPNTSKINADLESMLMVVTNLAPIIGYDKCSELAKLAHDEGKTIKEVIKEKGIVIDGDLDELLDPKRMVKPMDE
ncbi:MAG: class II fumarate hydratase [Candidatus Hodarchaeota archaeon]